MQRYSKREFQLGTIMYCLRLSQKITVSKIIGQFSTRHLHRSCACGLVRLSGIGHPTPAVCRGTAVEVWKRPKWQRTSPGCLTRPVLPVCQASSSSDQEGDRISKAYLGHDLGISVQKHDGNRLVYEVRGQTMLRFVSLTFYATAAVGLYLAPDFISSVLENDAISSEAIINLTAVGFAVIGLPSLLRMLSKRVVLKLYHNEARETYMAVTQSLLLTNKFTTFTLQDVVVREKMSPIAQMFNLTTFKVNKAPMHVNPYNFKLPSDYNHLLGYDKGMYG